MRAALLLLLMTAGVTKVFAQDYYPGWVDNIQYNVTSGTNVEVVGSLVDGNVLTIPPTITYQNQEYTVVGIGSYAFQYRYNYTRYVLPNTVTTIGTGAFMGSIIESIAFSDNLTTIGAGAFEGCEHLTMLNLTNCTNMTTIGQNAFRAIPNVWLIMLPESITTIGTGAFSGCTNLQNLYLPGSLTTIAESAFSNCSSLQSLTLPQSVTELGVSLFNGCTALKDLYVQRTTPPSASYQTFDGWFQNYAEHVYVPYGSGNTYQAADGWSNLSASNLIAETNILLYDYALDANQVPVATVTGHVGNVMGALEIPDYSLHYSTYYKVIAIATEAFENCTGITSVTFGEFMQNLGQNAFGGCSGITSVDMSACTNMTAIGGAAFEGCTSMTSVTLPQTLVSISGFAFYNCGLTSITLPKHVTNIGSNAFCTCNSLATITSFNPIPPTLGNLVFNGCDNITKIKVPYGSKTDYLAASGWQSFNESIYEEMESTFDFYYDDNNHIAIVMGYEGTLPSILEIPATTTHNDVEYTVTAINGSAFLNQMGVSQFILPNTITTIGSNAFRGCRYADINIPENLTALGEGAFADCDHITSVTLPEGLTSIPALAFYSCSFLTELHLPSTLTTIGIRAFGNCSNLETINTLAATAPTCSEGTFDNVHSTCWVNVPIGSYNSYENAFGWSALSIREGGLRFSYEEDYTSWVMGCEDYTFGDIVIPATIMNGTYTVTSIFKYAFTRKDYYNITSISIPATVNYIHENENPFVGLRDLNAITVDANNDYFKDIDGVLFSKDGTMLLAYPAGRTATSYAVPEGVTTICMNAFKNSKLTSISLPASVAILGEMHGNTPEPHFAFNGAKDLTTITVANDNPNFMSMDGVVFSKDGHTLLACPEGRSGVYVLPDGVTDIGRWAIQECDKLTSVTVNDGLENISEGAFYGCVALTSLVLSESVATMGSRVFNECDNLQVITCYSTTVPTSYGDPFDDDNIDRLIYVRADLLNDYQNPSIFWGQHGFTFEAITDPNIYITYEYDDDNLTATVTGLTDNTLSGALLIPGTIQNDNKTYTVTAIAVEAFKNCTGLTSITTPHTLETIGEKAFESCTGMTSVVIGRNVKSIGDFAFSQCDNLVNIDYYAVNCESIGTNAWNAVSSTSHSQTLTIRNSVKSIPNFAFFYLQYLTSVTIPNSTESIGGNAFAWCFNLASVTMGSNVKTIGSYAFWNSGITSIDLLNVETVGEGAFYECTSLQTVTLRNSLSTLTNKMFNGCTSLNNVHIPSGVRTIGKEAFKGCTSLTNLVFDNPFQGQLTTIGEEAFRGCGLTSVDIPSTVTTVETWAFYGNTNLTTVTIGTGMQYMGSNVFYNCTSLATVNYNATHCNTIANSFGSTGNSIKTLHIGNNVNYIPGNAFAGLKLASVTIPNGVTVIGEYAFYGCENITEITIPNSVTTIGYAAFADNMPETITLGSGLTEIGDYAFGTDESQQYLQTITSYNVTPPSVYGNSFNAGDYEYATLYVLGDATVTTYQTAPIWGNFFNIQSMEGYYFTGATNSNWGLPANWSNGMVPTSDPLIEYIAGEPNPDWNPDFCPNVIILADATVDIPNAFANKLTIMDGNVVTVTNHNKLYIGNWGATYSAADASALVIEEGGQLWNDVDVEAMVEKNITHYTGSRNGYYFIASPMGEFYGNETDWINPANVEGMIGGTYDLYRFDQTQYEAEWQNYKANPFVLRNGWGYLYANASDVTLQFAGTVKSNEYDSQLELVYTDEYIEVPIDPENPEAGYTYENYPYAGWNLMGNPFACDAYFGTSSGFENLNFYKMNDNGNAVEAVENISGTSIPACSGIFVKTPNQGTSLMFVRDLDPSMMSAPNNGSLQIALEQIAMRGTSEQIDNAIVSFNEGSQLEKFVLFQDNARIYIPQSGKDYAIVSAEPCGEMPINFVAPTSGQFTISVRPEAVPMSYLHLIDNLTGADTDLLENPSYTFEAKMTDYESRFKLVFICGDANDDNESFAFFNNGKLIVTNEGQATLQVIDINGRILNSERINGTVNVNINEVAGVYVLRLINGENVKTQKIVVR